MWKTNITGPILWRRKLNEARLPNARHAAECSQSVRLRLQHFTAKNTEDYVKEENMLAKILTSVTGRQEVWDRLGHIG